MRKSFYVFAAFAAILASCAKEVDVQTPETPEVTPETPQLYSLRATVDELNSKVSADNAGVFAWQAGDVISVLNNSNVPNNYTTTAGGASVDFQGSIAPENLGSYAFYPANEHHTNTVFALGPEIAWNPNASNMPMVGPIVGTTATFAAYGAVIKLVCFNINSSARKLEVASDSKKLSGTFSFASSQIETVATDEADAKKLTITFTDSQQASNMVFYVPVPVGNLGKLTFTIKDGTGNSLFSQQTNKAISVTKNQLVLPPALCCSLPDVDAELTNSEISSSGLTGSYSTQSITSTSGTWNCQAIKATVSTENYIQIRNNSTVSYLQTPTFSSNIKSITLHSVTNAAAPTPGAFTGNVYFRATAANDATAIASVTSSAAKDEDIVLNLPNGYKSGYIMVSAACRFKSVSVAFRPDYVSPIIATNDDALVIAVAAGDSNSTSTEFSYTNAVDDLGVQAISDKDWAVPTIDDLGSNNYRLTVTANKNNTADSREQATITLRATGVKETITVDQPSAIVKTPTMSVATGTYYLTQNVTLSCETADASIYYTIDGSEPSALTGTLYDAPINVTSTTTLKAIAVKDNYYDSSISVATYTFADPTQLNAPDNLTCSVQTSTTLTFTWDPVDHATGYYVKVGTGEWIELSDVLSYTAINLNSNTTYTLYVRSKGTANGQYTDTPIVNAASADGTTNAGGGAKLGDPAGVTITVLSASQFTGTWAKDEHASNYEWIVTTSSTYAGIIHSGGSKNVVFEGNTSSTECTLSGNTYTVNKTGLSLNGKYYLYVKAIGDDVLYLDSDPSSKSGIYLVFDLSSNPGEWPTANSTTATNYTYTLNAVDYTFSLKNVKCNSGYLMLTSTAALGLPAITGYKLTKVVANNSGGCSTSTRVGISSSNSSASYISGGSYQTWSTTSSSYTYNLSGTSAGTMYYVYVTNKNSQIVSLSLTYME